MLKEKCLTTYLLKAPLIHNCKLIVKHLLFVSFYRVSKLTGAIFLN